MLRLEYDLANLLLHMSAAPELVLLLIAETRNVLCWTVCGLITNQHLIAVI
jgi:hypothetical protein